MWIWFVILYLIAAVIYNQKYKIVLKTSEGKGALTSLLELKKYIIKVGC